MLNFCRCPQKGCIYIFSLPVSKETLKCPKCKNNVSLHEHILMLSKCESEYKKAFELMEKEETKEGIELLCGAIDNFHRCGIKKKFVTPPFTDGVSN